MYRIEYLSYRQGPYRIRIVSAADRIVPALVFTNRYLGWGQSKLLGGSEAREYVFIGYTYRVRVWIRLVYWSIGDRSTWSARGMLSEQYHYSPLCIIILCKHSIQAQVYKHTFMILRVNPPIFCYATLFIFYHHHCRSYIL